MHKTHSDKEGALLIIDSDPKVLVSIKSILMKDFDISIAASAEAFQQSASHPTPDLILLSLGMSACLQTLALAHAAPVILFGEDDTAAEISAYKLGGIGYIRRPFHPELLRQQVITLYHLAATISALKKTLKRETLLRQSIDVFAYSFGGARILVAEDVHFNQLILANILTQNQVDIDFADDGAMAVELFSAAPDTYAAILMDIQMPNMDGITATRIIRDMEKEKEKKVPIIALTASITPEETRKYKRLGMSAILNKPVDPEQLLCALIELTAG